MPKVENLSRKAFDELAKRVEARKAQIAIDDANRAAKKVLAMMKSLSVDPAQLLQMLQNPGAKKPTPAAPATAKKSKKGRSKKAPAKAATASSAKGKAASPKKAVKKKASKKMPAKVANPKNPAQVWSLHGKQPQWYKDALKSGVKPEAMLIKKAAKK